MLPDGWSYEKLGNVAPLQRGFDLPEARREPGGIPVITSAGCSGFHSTFKVRGPGVVLGRYGTIGDVYYVTEDFWPHNTTLWVTDFHGNDPQFVAYLLSSIDFSLHSGKTGVPGINRNDIHSIKVRVPPKHEQLDIVGVIAIWERGIRRLADLIAAKVRFKRGLMQQLLTGKRRFPEFVGDWDTVRIGDVASEVIEKNRDGHELPVLSCTKHRGLVDSLEYFGKRVFSQKTHGYKVVRRNQFAYATNHIEEGSIGLLTHEAAGLVSPMYTVFQTKSRILPTYLFRVLKTETYRQIFESFTSASVNRRGSLRWRQFRAIPLFLPGLEEQSRINAFFDSVDREIDLLGRELDALKLQKRGLMQKLLTGEVRVKLPEEAA